MRKTLIFIAILSTVALGATVKHNLSLNSFNAGQLSPLINSRSDIAQYKVGAKTLENMIVRSQGPIQRRPGTKYIATAKYNSNVRLMPVEESTENAYIIEMGHEYMRFFHTEDGNSVQITEPNGSGNAYEISTPYDGNDVFEVQFAQDEKYVRLVHPDYQTYKLYRPDDTNDANWTCAAIDFAHGPFLKENETTTTTITPSAVTGDGITLTATADIWDADHVGALWQLTHPVDSNTVSGVFTTTIYTGFVSYASGSGVDSNSATLAVARNQDYTITTKGNWFGVLYVQKSYDDGTTWINVFSSTGDGYGASNIQYAGTETVDDAIYRLHMTDHYGVYFHHDEIYMKFNYTLVSVGYQRQGIVRITDYTDANVVDANVLYDLGGTSATYHWAEGAWSDYRGWPRTITHHEQRCIYGGSASFPETIWASIIMEDNNDYDNFDASVGDNESDAWTYKLPGNNPIQWMVSREYLMVGTTKGIGRLGQPDKPITPVYAPTYRMQAINGCAYIQPAEASDTILFVELGNKKIREVTYTYTSERYIAPDLNILSEDITGDGITSIAWSERPDPILYCIRDDGALLTLTYNPHFGVTSWTENSTGTDEFESVSKMSGQTQDEIWTAVERNVNSTDYVYIEKFADFGFDDQDDMWFVDSGGTDPNDISHLEAESVVVLADGDYDGSYTVSSGAISASSATTYAVGIPYTSTFETMPLVSYDRDYMASSSYKSRVSNLVLDLYNTMTFNIGTDTDHKSEQDIDTLFTGVRPTEYPRGNWREPCLFIDCNEPSAFTLRGITCTLETTYAD